MPWRSPLKLEGTDMRLVRVGLVELGKFWKEEEEERGEIVGADAGDKSGKDLMQLKGGCAGVQVHQASVI